MKVLLTVLGVAASGVLALAQAPASDLHLWPVRRTVTMLVTPAGNVTIQTGEDGLLVVDAPPENAAAQAAELVRTLTPAALDTMLLTDFHGPRGGGAGAFITRAAAGRMVRVMAQDNVLLHLDPASASTTRQINAVIALPVTSPYAGPSRDFFFNGEAIFLHHFAAHTDSDTILYFRGADTVVAGDIFTPDLYPVIDVQNGGSVDGELAALNKILEIAVPARYQEGGTYVIPGKGRLCDEADVVEYRDMVTIIRDRVADLVKRKLTLQQVKAARPSRDFDTEYGATTGPWTNDLFVEAIYRSLTHGRT